MNTTEVRAIARLNEFKMVQLLGYCRIEEGTNRIIGRYRFYAFHNQYPTDLDECVGHKKTEDIGCSSDLFSPLYPEKINLQGQNPAIKLLLIRQHSALG